MNRACFLAAAALLCFSARDALPDAAPNPEYGQSLAPRKPTQVEMVEETVKIRLLREKGVVSAVFHLRNTGPAEILEVGFPDIAYTGEGVVLHGDLDPNCKLQELKVRVDGEVRAFEYHPVPRRESTLEMDEILAAMEKARAALESATTPEKKSEWGRRLKELEKEKDDDSWVGWAVWPMEFAAGQTRTVEVSYWTPYGFSDPPHLLGERDFWYVLRTGAGWKGPIGKAVITATPEEGLTPRHLAGIAPAGFTVSEAAVSWELVAIEPSQDVRMTVREWTGYDEAIRLRMEEHRRFSEAKEWGKAARALVDAALCQEKGGLLEDHIRTCRELIALQNRAKAGEVPADLAYLRTGWKHAWHLPWECRIVRALVKLKREEDARAAAPEAIRAIEAYLATKPKLMVFQERILRETLDEMRAVAEGGNGE